MHGSGLGRGYETTSFFDYRGDDSRRIAAFVFWRGGGIHPDDDSGRLSPMGVEVSFPGSRLLMPVRYLLLAVVLPLAWVADRIMAYRERRSRKPFKFVPMSVAVQEARQWARLERGVLQINARKFVVPDDSTLVVFVEDDPSQDDDLAITTHAIATENILPGSIPIRHMRGVGHMILAIHHDPVCREFIRRASERS